MEVHMTDLEINQITARMCGYTVPPPYWKPLGVVGPSDKVFLYDGSVWNPLVNAAEAMECLEELLKRDFELSLYPDGGHDVWKRSHGFLIRECPVREFFARALAEIGRMEEGK
jgi:hypothetical protein